MSDSVFRVTSLILAGSLSACIVANDLTERYVADTEKVRLVKKAEAHWSKVHRWLVEYEATPIGTNTGSIPAHKVMAIAEPSELYVMSAHFSPSYPWRSDPFCQEFFINQGKTTQRWTFNRAYVEASIKAGDYVPGTTSMDILLSIIPTWPLRDYKMPADARLGTPVIAIEALRSDYRLLSHSETIADEDCAIFDKNGIDRIWIAPNKGVCVMRREKRDPRSGQLLQRTLAEKVEVVAPNLWLPTEFRNQFYSGNPGTNMIVLESKVRILRCLINEEVPDSTFLPLHRPGSIRFEDSGRFEQVSHGGEDLLSEMVDFMMRYGRLPTKRFPFLRLYTFALMGLAIGICLGIVLFPASKVRLVEPEGQALRTRDICGK